MSSQSGPDIQSIYSRLTFVESSYGRMADKEQLLNYLNQFCDEMASRVGAVTIRGPSLENARSHNAMLWSK